MPMHHANRLLEAASRIILGKETRAAPRAGLPARRRPPADRGRARRRQDHARPRAGACLGLQFQRIQFTSDLLPADILGVSIFDRDSGLPLPSRAGLRPGGARRRDQPRHAEDAERAARGHGGAPGHRRRRDAPLPEPFFVIATQNPVEQIGTFPLPESAARPLPDAHPPGLPGPRRRARAAGRRGPARLFRVSGPEPAPIQPRPAAHLRAADTLRAGGGR
jgi:MoxR-like ATPase